MAFFQYRILSEIGQGQFGQVYCGSDRSTGELVALKKLDPWRSSTQRFLNELAILTRLQHPNIVQVQGLAYERKDRYLVTNYCPCGTLRHLMTPKIRPTLAQKLYIIQDILLGLEHIHHHRIIHCDLKPENILLNVSARGWSAQIADFGIAHWQDAAPSKHRLGDTGSPAYMAPERFYNKFSPASDIYAVGVMLYELVVGKRPFSGMPGEIMKAHFHQRVKIPKSLPLSLKIVLRTCLQKLPQRRYPSAQQMRFALEAVIAEVEHRQNQSIAISETTQQSEYRISNPSSVHGETLGDRLATRPAILLDCAQLSLKQTLDKSLQKLWTTPGYCFGLVQCEHETHLQRWSLSQEVQCMHWHLPPTIPTTFDINPGGTWLVSTQSDYGFNHELSSVQSSLQVISLTAFLKHQPIAIAHRPAQLWMLDARRLLVSVKSESSPHHALQLWNRRGHIYWSYDLPFPIRNLSRSLVTEDRVVALAESTDPTGVWIDLKPFRIQRFALPHAADWICPSRWGYIIVNVAGETACLNRRGKTIAKLALNLQESAKIQAVALVDPNILWIAIEHHSGSQIFTLNLSPYLPQRMVSFEDETLAEMSQRKFAGSIK